MKISNYKHNSNHLHMRLCLILILGLNIHRIESFWLACSFVLTAVMPSIENVTNLRLYNETDFNWAPTESVMADAHCSRNFYPGALTLQRVFIGIIIMHRQITPSDTSNHFLILWLIVVTYHIAVFDIYFPNKLIYNVKIRYNTSRLLLKLVLKKIL